MLARGPSAARWLPFFLQTVWACSGEWWSFLSWLFLFGRKRGPHRQGAYLVSLGRKAGVSRLLSGVSCPCTLPFPSGPCVSRASLLWIPVASHPRATGTQISRETPRVPCAWQSALRVTGGSGMLCRSQLWLMHVEGPRTGPEVACARAQSVEGQGRRPGVGHVGAALASGGTCVAGAPSLGALLTALTATSEPH